MKKANRYGISNGCVGGADHHHEAGIGSLWRWTRIAHAFFMGWKMVWREILFGFTVAGFITVFVPQRFWDMLFLISGDQDPQASPGFLTGVENELVAPVVAFFTFIGSMGNVPLAAML